jgi:hypothetical protein
VFHKYAGVFKSLPTSLLKGRRIILLLGKGGEEFPLYEKGARGIFQEIII